MKRCNRPSSIALLFAGLCAVPLLADAAAAQGLQGYALRIYRVESGLFPFVNVYLRTFDQNQQPLLNLNAMNVGLMVKGKAYAPEKRQYTVQPLRQRPEAVRTVLVLDASKTMAGPPFEASLKAAANFIDSKRPQDQVAILAIRDTDDGYELVSNWERDGDQLGRRLADLRCDGQRSRIYDTLAAAMQMSAVTASESAQTTAGDYPVSTAIVVFSDGKDEGSALSREELNGRITALENPVPIYSIAYSNVPTEHFKNLEALSKNSFGKYFPVGQTTTQMQRVVEEVQNILLGDYVLTFRVYQEVDGEQHAFKVGIEYPSGSGKYTYASARYEALQPPQVEAIQAQIAELGKQIRAAEGGDPYEKAVAASPAN